MVAKPRGFSTYVWKHPKLVRLRCEKKKKNFNSLPNPLVRAMFSADFGIVFYGSRLSVSLVFLPREGALKKKGYYGTGPGPPAYLVPGSKESNLS